MDAKDRQRLFRQRQTQDGLKQLTIYLPAALVRRVDTEADKQGASRDHVIAELTITALKAAKSTGDTAWLSELVGALVALEGVGRVSRAGAAQDTARTAHQRASRAYKSMPPELRESDAGKQMQLWLSRTAT
jgi:hypothetical protein